MFDAPVASLGIIVLLGLIAANMHIGITMIIVSCVGLMAMVGPDAA